MNATTHVLAERELAHLGRRAVGDDVAGFFTRRPAGRSASG
jgi:hypothetical protein